ncbi:hypothetical protein N7513_009598 [Penicillium frequentans]|nr:hypothetical protein N7513_009598 [Penicillium glabrum]
MAMQMIGELAVAKRQAENALKASRKREIPADGGAPSGDGKRARHRRWQQRRDEARNDQPTPGPEADTPPAPPSVPGPEPDAAQGPQSTLQPTPGLEPDSASAPESATGPEADEGPAPQSVPVPEPEPVLAVQSAPDVEGAE